MKDESSVSIGEVHEALENTLRRLGRMQPDSEAAVVQQRMTMALLESMRDTLLRFCEEHDGVRDFCCKPHFWLDE